MIGRAAGGTAGALIRARSELAGRTGREPDRRCRGLLLAAVLVTFSACCPPPKVVVVEKIIPCVTQRPPLDDAAALPDWAAEAWLRCRPKEAR